MKKRMLAAAPVLGALLVAGALPDSPSSATVAEDATQQLPKTTTQVLELDHPVAIADAERVASGLDETVTAYRFDKRERRR